jgi:nicotine blue oxidoreductase
VVATYAGQPRNPVGVARPLWAAMSASAVGDEGARAFIRAHPDLVDAVECGDIADAADIDSRADLASPHREES